MPGLSSSTDYLFWLAYILHSYSAAGMGCTVLLSTRLCICMFVCPIAYLKNLTFLNMLPVAVARSISDSNAIGYVGLLPISWMTYDVIFYTMERMGHTQNDKFRPVYQVAAPGEVANSGWNMTLSFWLWPIRSIIGWQRDKSKTNKKTKRQLSRWPNTLQ